MLCTGCAMNGLCYVRAVLCTGCAMYGLCYVRAVLCTDCVMYGLCYGSPDVRRNFAPLSFIDRQSDQLASVINAPNSLEQQDQGSERDGREAPSIVQCLHYPIPRHPTAELRAKPPVTTPSPAQTPRKRPLLIQAKNSAPELATELMYTV